MRGAGFEEVRVVGSSMLEGWLNNPAHLRAAKDLLDRILQHTRGTSENDFNTVANLLALRVTSLQAPGQIKTLNNIFSDLIGQLVQRRSEYATLALKVCWISVVLSTLCCVCSMNCDSVSYCFHVVLWWPI
jgi:hypothetical protein